MLFPGEPPRLAHEVRPDRQRDPEIRGRFPDRSPVNSGDATPATVNARSFSTMVFPTMSGSEREVPGPESIAQHRHERRIGRAVHSRDRMAGRAAA